MPLGMKASVSQTSPFVCSFSTTCLLVVLSLLFLLLLLGRKVGGSVDREEGSNKGMCKAPFHVMLFRFKALHFLTMPHPYLIG